MPTSKRRTSSGPTVAAAKSKKSQSTLAFHGKTNKVTKPNAPKPGKKDPSLLKAEEITPNDEDPTTADLSIVEQAVSEAKAPLTRQEEEAFRITDAQINKYWKAKEAGQLASRVHQDGLTIKEKVCREFDTNSRFGPCMGIARIKRWKRAQTLGLKPPIEVLAILLKEQEEGNVRVQMAYIDELMSHRTAEPKAESLKAL